MREAIAVAQESLASNDVPVGALIIDPSGKVIATGVNEREAKSDPTAHAEIVAMRKAATNGWRLDNHTLVVTLEPCAMCAGAIAQAQPSEPSRGNDHLVPRGPCSSKPGAGRSGRSRAPR